jgi:glyoxylase-like metal-dependent hydrolase (beta-lactamase superfamily II)
LPKSVTARAGRFIVILEETFLRAGAEISSNVYVTLHGNKFYVFDAGGHPDLLPVLEGIGVTAGDIGGVFLTHGHYDHVTGLSSLRDAGAAAPVPVFINAKDIPLLRKTVEPALLSDLEGGRAALEQLGLRGRRDAHQRGHRLPRRLLR